MTQGFSAQLGSAIDEERAKQLSAPGVYTLHVSTRSSSPEDLRVTGYVTGLESCRSINSLRELIAWRTAAETDYAKRQLRGSRVLSYWQGYREAVHALARLMTQPTQPPVKILDDLFGWFKLLRDED